MKSKCKARKKTGKPCRKYAISNSIYCYWHCLTYRSFKGISLIKNPIFHCFIGLFVVAILAFIAIGAPKQDHEVSVSPRYMNEGSLSDLNPVLRSKEMLEKIGVLQAWSYSKGSPEITIAVLSTGVDFEHADLLRNIWKNKDEIPNNRIDDDKNYYIDDFNGVNVTDDGEHWDSRDKIGNGTLIAGIIAANCSDGIVMGIAPNCRIMPIKIIDKKGNSKNTDYAKGIVYAVVQGADIILIDKEPSEEDFLMVKEAITFAYSMGCFIVATAGSRGINNKVYPAAHQYVFSVSSIDIHSKRKMEWSNYGEWIDISAPADQIVSTFPSNSYKEVLGPLVSVSIVTGTIALMLSANDTLKLDEIKKILEQTAIPIDSLNPEFAGNLGAGMINTLNALKKSMELK